MNYDNPYIVDISTLNISIPYHPDYGIDGALPISTRQKMTEIAQNACFDTHEVPKSIICALYQDPDLQNTHGQIQPRGWGREWLPYAQHSGPNSEYAYDDKDDVWYENIYKTALKEMKDETDAVQIGPWKVGLIELEVIHSITCARDLKRDNFKNTHTICYQYSLCPRQHWSTGLPPTNTEWSFEVIHDLKTMPRPPINIYIH